MAELDASQQQPSTPDASNAVEPNSVLITDADSRNRPLEMIAENEAQS